MKVMNSVLRIIEGLLTDVGALDDSVASCNAHTMWHIINLRNIHLAKTPHSNDSNFLTLGWLNGKYFPGFIIPSVSNRAAL